MADRDDARPEFSPKHRIVGAIVLVALVVTLKGGAFGNNVAVPLVALIVGSALLLLSAFWGQARSALLPLVPGGMREWLPAARVA